MFPCLDILSFFWVAILGFRRIVSISSNVTSKFGRASRDEISSLVM